MNARHYVSNIVEEDTVRTPVNIGTSEKVDTRTARSRERFEKTFENKKKVGVLSFYFIWKPSVMIYCLKRMWDDITNYSFKYIFESPPPKRTATKWNHGTR